MIALTTRQKIVLFALLAGMFLSYGIFAFRSYLLGPSLVVLDPQDASMVDSPLITVRGTTRSISNITLNGNKIFVDPDGNFADQLLLSYGYNIINLTAQDRYGRTVSKDLSLTLR